MKHIGYEDAVLLLKEIVTDRGPEWVYPNFDSCRDCAEAEPGEGYCSWHMRDGCRYFTAEGAPACIVGEFISRTLQPEEYNSIYLEGRIAKEALNYLPLEVDDRTLHLLSVAQARQDEGTSWGESLTRAIDSAGQL